MTKLQKTMNASLENLISEMHKRDHSVTAMKALWSIAGNLADTFDQLGAIEYSEFMNLVDRKYNEKYKIWNPTY